jgi:hypothetical protein
MYPQRELTRLAAHKVALQRDIARHRDHCAAAAARVAQPLGWLDRVVACWRRFAPFAQIAAVPLGLLLTRKIFSRRKLLDSMVRWGPLAFGALRALRSKGTAMQNSSR